MMYDSILARSFSRYEQKLRYGAFFGCLLIALSFCTVFKPYLDPLNVLNLRVSMGVDGLKMFMVKDARSYQQGSTDNSSSKYIIHENISNSHVLLDDISGNSDQQLMKNTSGSSDQYILEDVSSSGHVVDDRNNYSQQNFNSPNSSSPNVVDYMKNCSHKIVSNTSGTSQQMVKDNNTSQLMEKVSDFVPKKEEAICNFLKMSDFCEIKDDIRIEGSSGTVSFIASSIDQRGFSAKNRSWIIRPYARKTDSWAMHSVRQWSVKSVMDPQQLPQCTKSHSVPAIVFSNEGYAANHFHAFADIIFPLYSTSRLFNGEVQFLVTNKRSSWVDKFGKLLNKLSRYDIIDIDKEKEVHCFPGGIIGLKRYDNKELNVDPSKSSNYTMKDFRDFLRSSYSLRKATAIKMRNGGKKRPRLLIISRMRTRTFTNVGKIAQMARALGYKVIVAEASTNVAKFAETVNSCDVMLGVHGAGLTNMVFLPENAILIQVVPLGIEWLSRFDFEEPSKAMNLRYLQYKIQVEESTLIQQYPLDHDILRNPFSIGKFGWVAFRSVYLDKQNVELDVNRFRGTLVKALELLHQ